MNTTAISTSGNTSDEPTPTNTPFSKTPLGKVFITVGEILTNKLIIFAFTVIYICKIAIFAQTYNECMGSDGCGAVILLLGCVAFILISLALAGIGDFAHTMKWDILKNIQITRDPLDYMCKISWQQLASVCMLTIIPCVYLAGSFTARPEDQYVKIINGKPLLDGNSVWVYPSTLDTHAKAIKKKQDFWLSDVRSMTADGALIKSSLYFNGQLTSASHHWMNFEKEKEEFSDRLKGAYIHAIRNMKLEELDKTLKISFNVGKEAQTVFENSLILPNEDGVIEAYGFKVLAKQTPEK